MDKFPITIPLCSPPQPLHPTNTGSTVGQVSTASVVTNRVLVVHDGFEILVVYRPVGIAVTVEVHDGLRAFVAVLLAELVASTRYAEKVVELSVRFTSSGALTTVRLLPGLVWDIQQQSKILIQWFQAG